MSPKLGKADASAVNKTEAASGFTPLPPGLYTVALREVQPKKGAAGPYWNWVFEIPEGFENAKRRFFYTTSLGETSRPFLKKVFDAFGVPADTDTDKLCGQWATVSVDISTIKDGEKAGKQTNHVIEVLPYVDEDDEPDPDDDDDEESVTP